MGTTPYTPRHKTEDGPYDPADWTLTCAKCGKTGLFLGDSPYCVACEPCPICNDTGDVALPRLHGPDEVEMVTRPCPTCCPSAWPDGFPGLAGHYNDRSVWLIEPTGRYADHQASDGRAASGVAPLG